ncbi:MAG: DNA mismatch endonuclease Vsr [Candidatus Omnitrophota bacterium]|nr:MAG: DNA mismatch endonuclease Vsr [Candidatus Omnitrophota bacterium]
MASLFCGCGGTDAGMLGGFTFLGSKYEKHPVQIVYANDIDASAARIYDANFKHKCLVKDIRKIKAAEIPDHDILAGGFPCQSFSIVAQNPPRLGYRDENGRLFFEMCRILRNKKPLAFVAENVKGILSANNKHAFPLIIKEFEKCGYIVSWCLLNAANYGIPQRRERVFIVGIRKNIGRKFYPPDSTHRPESDLLAERKWVSLKRVVFPHAKVPKKYFFSDRAHKGLHNSNPAMNKGRAQDPEKVCNTVGAHLAKVSLNSTDPVLKINGRFRRFAPREVARIQSFPDTFRLPGPDTAKYKALGNAIPPVLMWHMTERLLEILVKGPAEDARTGREKRSYNMARICSKNTLIERILDEALKSLGLEYKRNVKGLPGKPDIVFEKNRLAVFCDSTFWHGRHYPECVERINTNKSFWKNKILRNMERDKKTTKELRYLGWKVLRFWDTDIENRMQAVIGKIEKILGAQK